MRLSNGFQTIAATALVALTLPGASAGAHTLTRPTRNILGGSSAVGTTLGMVARITDTTAAGEELCTGTVVSADVSLTAGHCAEDIDTSAVNSPSGYSG